MDTSGFERLARLLDAAGRKIEPEVAAAVNRVGEAGTLAIIRTLPQQTGLKRKVILRFLRATTHAAPGYLVFSIKGRGGDISLKYFGAREEGAGVSAAPWNRRRLYAGGFMKSGRSPNRRLVPKLNGQVYRNVDGGRWAGKVEKLRSGLYLPYEMVTGESGEAWTRTVRSEIPAAVDAAIRKAFGG